MSENIISLARLAEELKGMEGKAPLLLVTHERPDGDAIGSLFGLLFLLRENGIKADAILPYGVPDNYVNFLEGVDFLTDLTQEKAEKYGGILYLDCAKRDRASSLLLREKLPLSWKEFGIDHHEDNSHYAADFSFLDAKAASCSQILYFLGEKASWHISEKAATFLLLGLVTDTGCFRFDNTSPAAFLAAGNLLQKGADYHRIINETYMQKAENLILLEGEMVSSHLQKNKDNTFACIYLAPELLEKYGVDLRNTEQLIDSIRPMKGLKGCAIVRREKSGYKASLRSKDEAFPVGPIARLLGGGGHKMAAGCSIDAPDGESAVKILFETVEKIWKKK